MEFTTYKFTQGEEKVIEKVVNIPEAQIVHMILPQNEQLPKHFSNTKHVMLIVVRGQLSFTRESNTVVYDSGTIVHVPYHTEMLIRNEHEATLEFFVVKTPHPEKFSE